ncbi:MAG: MMPL family transporter [Legionella sp.]
MQNSAFYHLGHFTYRFRWPIIGLWVLLILSCTPFLPNIVAPFKTTGFIDERSESAKTEEHLNKELGYLGTNKLLIMYHSSTLKAHDPRFLKAIKTSLADLKGFPLEHEIIYPDKDHPKSKDKHTSYVVVIIKGNEPINEHFLEQFKQSIKPPEHMSVQFGGEPFFVDNVNKQTQTDLLHADMIAAPVAVLTMLFVFGSLIAAFLPIVLGGGCALIILTSLFVLGHYVTLSIFTLNIALLLGLCLCLDYALFIISRFREELENTTDTAEAIARTQATAGKAVLFSGLAVFVSLSALFLFPINILFSVAVGGLAAVFYAVLTAIILLPAILAVLDKKINLLAVRKIKENEIKRHGVWHWLATTVVYRPYRFFLLSLVILLALGYPFLSVQFGVSDYKIFPKHSESRDFYEIYSAQFDDKELNPIILSVEAQDKPILARANLYKLYDLTQQLEQNPLIAEVNSIVTINGDLSKNQYYALYHSAVQTAKSPIKELLSSTTSKQLTTVTVISKNSINSPQTAELINELQTLKAPEGLTTRVSGIPVSNKDVLSSIYKTLPYAILWIMVFSYIILFLLLRSVFLPFKAILMNLLSLSACYGALVLVFQDGYLAHFLNFEPQGMLDISLLVIIFCALFGFSMDYEVFLLSRIKEYYEKTGNNAQSIIYGIEKSSRIITSAALIVIVLCGSFLVADVLMIKAFGLGIAVAIFVDAFLIRTILVPSTMILLEKLNWYLPKWLDKITPKL